MSINRKSSGPPTFHRDYVEDLRAFIAKRDAEIERLRDLLADKDYIRIKAAHNAGQLSWFNMVKEREARAGYALKEPKL
jgi:hypothetical protein